MVFSSILRSSARRAAPIAARLIANSHKNTCSSAILRNSAPIAVRLIAGSQKNTVSSAVLRRAAPIAARLIAGSQRNTYSSAVFSAVLRRAAPIAARLIAGSQNNTVFSVANLSPNFTRAAGYSASRHFCSNSVATSEKSSDQTLLQVVQSEIDVVVESDEFGKDVEAPGDFPFKIEDTPGESTVTLTREYDGEVITVEVQMPNLVTGEEEEEDDDDDDDDKEGKVDSNVPLIINIAKKNGGGPYLEFDCTATPDSVEINGLSLKNPETEDQLAYEGPDFYDLDENLQKAFHKYLEIRGIKPSITNFLHEYMIEKDNKEYLRWLKDVKRFVEA